MGTGQTRTLSLEKFAEVHSTLKDDVKSDYEGESIEAQLQMKKDDVDMLQMLGYTMPPEKMKNQPFNAAKKLPGDSRNFGKTQKSTKKSNLIDRRKSAPLVETVMSEASGKHHDMLVKEFAVNFLEQSHD